MYRVVAYDADTPGKKGRVTQAYMRLDKQRVLVGAGDPPLAIRPLLLRGNGFRLRSDLPNMLSVCGRSSSLQERNGSSPASPAHAKSNWGQRGAGGHAQHSRRIRPNHCSRQVKVCILGFFTLYFSKRRGAL